MLLVGGPRDGEQLQDLDQSDLTPDLIVPPPTGGMARYRKTDEYEQVHGANTAEPYSRRWVYKWSGDR